jgi:hypothetical protein
MKALAQSLIDSLKGQPFALVLLAINVAFLVAIYFATARKDALIADLIKQCMGGK